MNTYNNIDNNGPIPLYTQRLASPLCTTVTTAPAFKDDPFITSSFETLSTPDTIPPHQNGDNGDPLISIMIWNKPLIQYQIPTRPIS